MMRFFLALFLYIFFIRANAQHTFKEVVIREQRLESKTAFEKNTSIQLITSEEIKRMNAQSVSDILHYILGIQAGNRGMDNAQTDIKMNGGTFEQTLILINGHPILDPQTGHHLMNLPIHINDIHHIEILSGPHAHSYGLNGLAGSINIVTKQVDKSGISISAYSGSNFIKDSLKRKYYANGGVQFGVSHHGKNSKQYLSASGLSSSGFMHNTQVNNFKIFYTNSLSLPSNHTINLQFAYLKNAFGANGYYAPPYDINSIEKVNTLWATLDHAKKLNEKWKVKSNFSYRNNYDDYIFKKDNPSYYHNTHRTQTVNANINVIYKHLWGELALGAATNFQAIASNSLGNNNRFNSGLFLENSFQYHLLQANIGLYGNYNSAWGFSWLPALDLGYQVHKKIRVFACVGSANRIPTYTDLYYKGPSNIGNINLQPERSYGIDIGVKYHTPQLQLSGSAFTRNVSNLIDWTKEKSATIWQPANFGEQNVKGVQVISKALFTSKHSIFLKEISAKYQYLNLEYVNTVSTTDSKYALDYFKHQVLFSASLSAFKNLTLSLHSRYQNRFNYKDYALFDTRIAYQYKNHSLYLDINNLSNTKYLESNAYPLVGRWFQFGVNLNFKH